MTTVILMNEEGYELDRVEIDEENPTLKEIALETNWILEPGDMIIIHD